MPDDRSTHFYEMLRRSGTRVRLRFDPTRVGACTGETAGEPGSLEVKVAITGRRPEWFLEQDLELVDQGPADDLASILAGSVGRARDLRREFTRVQLSGRLSELFYSMDTTNTEFMPHQFKPVLAILDSPSQGLLIADEVGLGKTIEAGLIWTELRFRKKANRLLIVCPAMLTEKWRAELRNRFGTPAEIVSASRLLDFVRGERLPGTDMRAFICSLQGIRPPTGWDSPDDSHRADAAHLARHLADATPESPLFDLAVIDEAHYMRNRPTASAELGRLLRGAADHLVLLTATPINTRASDLHSLVSIVDPEQFRFEHEFQAILEANRPLVQASNLLKRSVTTAGAVLEKLEEASGSWVLTASEQLGGILQGLRELKVDLVLTPEQRVELRQRVERVNLLGHIVTRTRKREVLENRVIRKARHSAVPMSPPEAALYQAVTDAVRAYAIDHAGVEGFLLATPQRQMASSMCAAARRWLGTEAEAADEEFAWEAFGADQGRDPTTLIDHIRRSIAGVVDLKGLRNDDTKFGALVTALSMYFEGAPTEKVVVFSYFRDTLRYLQERLRERGIAAAVVMGGQDKQAIIEQFRDDPGQKVLLSSEVAAEGVDLQFMRFVINYDLPWNPMKVEQRIGRIDRIGQRADTISILSLVYGGTIDERILLRLYQRLDLFESTLGSTEEILGDEIAELTRELLSQHLTPEQEEARIKQTADAMLQRQADEKVILESESDLVGLGDYVREQIVRAHETQRRVSDEDLVLYIRDFLAEQRDCVFRGDPTDRSRYFITLSSELAVDVNQYVVQGQLRPTALARGHETPVRIVNHVSAPRGTHEELVNQFHSFISFINQRSRGHREEPPVMAVKLPAAFRPEGVRPGVYAFVAENWTFMGSREHELLRVALAAIAGGVLIEGPMAFDALNVIRLQALDWPESASEVRPAMDLAGGMDRAGRALARGFARETAIREAENADRIRVQTESVKRNAQRREQRLAERVLHARINRHRTLKAEEAKLANAKKEAELALERLGRRSALERRRGRLSHGIVKVE